MQWVKLFPNVTLNTTGSREKPFQIKDAEESECKEPISYQTQGSPNIAASPLSTLRELKDDRAITTSAPTSSSPSATQDRLFFLPLSLNHVGKNLRKVSQEDLFCVKTNQSKSSQVLSRDRYLCKPYKFALYKH